MSVRVDVNLHGDVSVALTSRTKAHIHVHASISSGTGGRPEPQLHQVKSPLDCLTRSSQGPNHHQLKLWTEAGASTELHIIFGKMKDWPDFSTLKPALDHLVTLKRVVCQ